MGIRELQRTGAYFLDLTIDGGRFRIPIENDDVLFDEGSMVVRPTSSEPQLSHPGADAEQVNTNAAVAANGGPDVEQHRRGRIGPSHRSLFD
jgi:hypothetical protein